MFFKNNQMFFIIFLIMGTVIAISANSWFMCWVGLEINLMSLIPLILSELNFKSTEAAIKYFLSQAMASVILIASACVSTLFETAFYSTDTSIAIFLSLAIKAGLAPFHFWFPQVIYYVSWVKCTIILTWQKIAPFLLMSYFANKKMTYFLISLAAIIGALGGFNQVNVKLLLTYSSIAHSAWMLMVTSTSFIIWSSYFLMYVFIVIPIIFSFNKFNITLVTEIYKTKTTNLAKNLLIFLILSLGGLPPFLGFSAKLMAIMTSLGSTSLLVLLILVSSSLISLFFYTKMFYNMSMNSKPEVKLNSGSKFNSYNSMLMLSTTGNLILSSMVLLI